MLSQVKLRFLILFYSEVYGLNKQIYSRVAIAWAFYARPLFSRYKYILNIPKKGIQFLILSVI